jgi:hypothetical protein
VKRSAAIIIFIFLFHLTTLYCQTTWSIATDFSAMRNIKKDQQFWSAGHTIRGEAHFTKRESLYGWVSYFIRGKFKNDLVAEAKSPATTPQTIAFRNKANMSLKEFSIGWKHYFKGDCGITKPWSLYGVAGLGIIGGKIKNTFQTSIDTSLYNTPILNGDSRFKRLTADLGIGWEAPITGDIILYNELKVWIPASDYPNKYLLNNSYVPLIASFHFGIRVYFE